MTDHERFRMLQVARQLYPAYRVELTELFSRYMINNYGYHIDWLMQPAQPQKPNINSISNNERVILGRTITIKSFFHKVLNKLFGFMHDLSIVKLGWSGRYDVIQVRDKVVASLIALCVCKLKGIQFYYWMTYSYPEGDQYSGRVHLNQKSWFKGGYEYCRGLISGWLLNRIILPRADHVFVQSKKMLELIHSYGLPYHAMTAVPMGVVVSETDVDPIKDQRLENREPIIYLGTMIAARRIDFLIDVIAMLKHQRPKVLLLLIGSGSKADIKALQQKIKLEQLSDHVLLLDFMPLKKAWQYVCASRVALAALPPDNLALDTCSPTKVVEYMALRCPVVVNDVGDQAEIVRQAGAGLVANYSIKSYCQAITQIIQNPHEAANMASRGFEFVSKQRSYAKISADLDAVYQRLLSV